MFGGALFMGKSMGKRITYLTAPALVAAVLLSVYLWFHLFPFGTRTVAWCDMNQQVIPFLMDFKNILNGQADLFLNLQNAGGMNFWGVFLFFISSPFSFLVLFVDKAQIYYFVNILLLLKMMVCALTASVYFTRRFRNLNVAQTTVLSAMYAFCGYTMFYYQNIVWLDVMYLFPLLLLALQKLAEERKPLFYTLVFAAILTVNFYLTYMVVVFLILSAGVWLFFFVPKQERGETTLLFGLATAAAGLLTGVVWLPSLLEYLSSARTGDILSSLRTGSLITRLDTTFTVILCTGAVGAAIVIALAMRLYRDRRVHLLLILLAMTLLPVFIEPINKMWQTGSYQSFPVRYGYIPIFLGITLFAVCISEINRKADLHKSMRSSSVSVVTAAIAVAAVIFCAYTILRYEYNSVTIYTQTLWGNADSFQRLFLFAAAVSFVYLILLLQYHYQQLTKTLFTVMLCALTVIEAFFYSSVYIASAKTNAQYYSPVMSLEGQISDSSLYRVKMDEKYFDVNLIGGLGYNSMSHYTSLTSRQYMFGMKKLGYSSYWMEVSSNGGTELTDALLGNKYTITRSKNDFVSEENTQVGLDNMGSIVYSNGLYTIRENKNALPAGIIMKAADIQNFQNLPDLSRLQMQQYLFQTFCSSDQMLFEQYTPTTLSNVNMKRTDQYEITLANQNDEGTIRYEIPVKGTQTLYFDCFDQLTNQLNEHINSSFSITVNGKLLAMEYPTQQENGLYRLGTFTNEKVIVDVGLLRNVYAKSFGIAGMKENVLSSAVASTVKADLHQSGNSIVGTAKAGSDGEYLFLPVNYSKGFSAQVNGKPAELSRVFDTFMAVKLEKGTNQIAVTYVPDGFLPGAVLSLFGAAGVVFLEWLRRRGVLHRMQRTQMVFRYLFAAIFICVIVAVYLAPVIIHCL